MEALVKENGSVASLCRQEQGSDFRLRCAAGAVTLPIHSPVLKSHSRFFEIALDPASPFVEAQTGVLVKDHWGEAETRALLQLCYTGKADVLVFDLPALVRCAMESECPKVETAARRACAQAMSTKLFASLKVEAQGPGAAAYEAGLRIGSLRLNEIFPQAAGSRHMPVYKEVQFAFTGPGMAAASALLQRTTTLGNPPDEGHARTSYACKSSISSSGIKLDVRLVTPIFRGAVVRDLAEKLGCEAWFHKSTSLGFMPGGSNDAVPTVSGCADKLLELLSALPPSGPAGFAQDMRTSLRVTNLRSLGRELHRGEGEVLCNTGYANQPAHFYALLPLCMMKALLSDLTAGVPRIADGDCGTASQTQAQRTVRIVNPPHTPHT
ncbi:hypothetical protein JKP88DRAFT_253799 [Tribonema minus]|uniref:BTB domain-containing protein n=1 Tax=Tribonema minus TaxID=303371 RepID=A0A836CJQ5_9STRA|nr:hypothetical protein JKP88DRAFT_253799 [Tribonema minus]